MKTSELTAGPILNSLTAIAQGWERRTVKFKGLPDKDWWGIKNQKEYMPAVEDYQPSDNSPAQAFELMKVFGLSPQPHVTDNGIITSWGCSRRWPCKVINPLVGPEIEVAICKAVCAAKWGETIPGDVMERVV